MDRDSDAEFKDESATLILAEQEVTDKKGNITCCDRVKMLYNPIKSKQTICKKNGEIISEYVIIPEVFRMWFYFGFIIFTVIALIVTVFWNDIHLNYHDTALTQRFGYNQICIWWDYPPFSHFGSTLWVPQVINILLYEYFDNFRVYANYMDNENKTITKKFYILWTTVQCFESFGFIFFLQITATQPYHNIYLHIIPYLFTMFSFYTLTFRHFVYFYKIGILDEYEGWYYYLGWVYSIALFIIVIVQFSIDTPNLFEAYIWKKSGWEWTLLFSHINHYIYVFFVIVFPIFLYFIHTKDVPPVKFTVNAYQYRSNRKK